jgi:hypothetical protein
MVVRPGYALVREKERERERETSPTGLSGAGQGQLNEAKRKVNGVVQHTSSNQVCQEKKNVWVARRRRSR